MVNNHKKGITKRFNSKGFEQGEQRARKINASNVFETVKGDIPKQLMKIQCKPLPLLSYPQKCNYLYFVYNVVEQVDKLSMPTPIVW
jgi:hypothetical protein